MSVGGDVGRHLHHELSNRPPVTATVTFTNEPCPWCEEWPCECARAREELCACGGRIIPARRGWTGILEAVRAHQATELHAYWSMLHYRVDLA